MYQLLVGSAPRVVDREPEVKATGNGWSIRRGFSSHSFEPLRSSPSLNGVTPFLSKSKLASQLVNKKFLKAVLFRPESC